MLSKPHTRTTRAVLAIEPSDDCPFQSVDDIIDARNSLVDDSCHCQYVTCPSPDDEPVVGQTSQTHETDCACHMFGKYGCVPNLLEVEDEQIVFSVFLPNRDVITDLVEELRAVSELVSLRRITDGCEGVGDEMQEVDLTELTEKQRETLNLAIEGGYYEQPSGLSLKELAADLDVSKQAVSQRLRAAEQALFEQLSTKE